MNTTTTPRGPVARPWLRRLPILFLAALTALAAGAGCDRGGGAGEADAAARPAGTAAGAMGSPGAAMDGVASTPAGVVALEPWVRVAIMPEADPEDRAPVNSAGYIRLRNETDQDDALVAVDFALADTVELHTVSMDGGIMRMRPVQEVPLPAGGEAVLAPGGFHIMLIGLDAPLTEGDTAPLSLRFRSGRTLDVTAPVRRAPPR